MSSFVIAKPEFVKAAGLIAAIAEEKSFWIYNYKAGRNFTPDDYYDYFVLAYQFNAYSVQEQYGDRVPENDPDEYRELFREYKQRGRGLAVYNKLDQVCGELISFFRSVLYQVENQYMYNQLNHFFSAILWELVIKCKLARGESWGSLENIPDGPRVCRIM